MTASDLATAAEDEAPDDGMTPLRLVLSRIVGEVKGRHVAPQICRLVGEAFGVPGPWPDEEYSLREIGCDWDEVAARWSIASAHGRPLPDAMTGAFFPTKLWPVASPLVVYEPVEVVFRGCRGARAVGERGATAAGPGDS